MTDIAKPKMTWPTIFGVNQQISNEARKVFGFKHSLELQVPYKIQHRGRCQHKIFSFISWPLFMYITSITLTVDCRTVFEKLPQMLECLKYAGRLQSLIICASDAPFEDYVYDTWPIMILACQRHPEELFEECFIYHEFAHTSLRSVPSVALTGRVWPSCLVKRLSELQEPYALIDDPRNDVEQIHQRFRLQGTSSLQQGQP